MWERWKKPKKAFLNRRQSGICLLKLCNFTEGAGKERSQSTPQAARLLHVSTYLDTH